VDPAWERSDLLGRPAEADDGRIYVPNPGEGSVLVVAADGSSQESFGHRGTKRGEFAFPVGVTIGPKGIVLVLDRMKHSVLVFGPDNVFQGEFSRFGFGPGDLYFPMGIAALPDGRVYVAQGFQGRVQVFRLGDATPPDSGAAPGGR
jgi:DNA-binding beta-propeller fold protein YncE